MNTPSDDLPAQLAGTLISMGNEEDTVIQFLLATAGRLNNWDLVDTVVPYTLGPWSPDQIRLGRHDHSLWLAAKLHAARTHYLAMIQEG